MAAAAYGHGSHPDHRGAPISAPNAPPGTFPPGTLITVGAHKCTIQRYLSEGGFAHVYLVRLSAPTHGSDIAVLKRVAVPDKEALAGMRVEVETMKRLRGHRHIVTYIDSHASHLQGGGYEVFLLMEYCSGGGLIDFMNTRLQHRLTEPEVLKIFSDVTQGVACMHYLQPPQLHRDLKVENVLISANGGYKLCDFGSSCVVKPAPQTVVECRLLEEDIQKHTTLQYRSPEMIDVFRRQPIDEKSDVWALGVLLYKLCYYTTPFEEQGQLAILNASFTYPSYPAFSDRLKGLIASMLRENPNKRPNIYQVVHDVCYMRGREVPIKDIYSNRTAAPSQPHEKHLPPLPVQPPPSVIAYEAPVQPQAAPLPDITPMRRGRPGKTSTNTSTPQSTATSKTRANNPSRPATSDPFAALDAKTPLNAKDELSSRFPSVEQFSILHDSGNRFQFAEGKQSPLFDQHPKDLGERVAERLAEQAFAVPPQAERIATGDRRGLESISRGLTGKNASSRPILYEPQPKRPVMVSTGTMTSPSPSPSPKSRFDSSAQNQELTMPPPSSSLDAYPSPQRLDPRPNALDSRRSSSYAVSPGKTPSSSRPSLEAARTSSTDLLLTTDQPVVRSKSANSRPRPHSLYVDSNIEYLRDLESPSTQEPSTAGVPSLAGLRLQHSGASVSSQMSEHIESNVAFLRAMEQEGETSKQEKRSSSGSFVQKHVKRSSMPSISLPKGGGKNKLSGKFGDALRRFERNIGGNAEPPSPPGNPRPPIPDSYGASDGGDEWEVSSQEIPPEVKRELEKRQLAQEERRVAAAAAEYKKQVSSSSGRPHPTRTRANSIQKRVHTLLNENKNRDPPPKTAEGYGRYTDKLQQPQQQQQQQQPQQTQQPQQLTGSRSRPSTATEPLRLVQRAPSEQSRPLTSTGPPSAVSGKVARKVLPQQPPRPNPPPKPNKLRTGGNAPQPTQPPPQEEDWERSFAKRYPSLSGLEMEAVVAGSERKV